MKHLCDSNVFIAIAVQQHAHHGIAAHWFDGLGEEDTACFCRATQTSFLRLLTQRLSAHYTPLTNRRARQAYDELCQDDAMVFVEEPEGLESLWRKLACPDAASPKVWMDAYLAAFSMAGNLRLVSLDKDFKSYEADGLDLHLLCP